MRGNIAQDEPGANLKLVGAADSAPAKEEENSAAAQGRARLHATLRWKRWLRRLGLAALFFVLSLMGAAVAVTLFGSQTFHWRAFDIEAGIQPSARGETRLIFAPLGEVRAHTHLTPVAFNVSLRSISFDDMKKLIVSPPPRKELEADFQRVARQSLRELAYREVTLGAIGALIVPVLFRLKRFRHWFLCAVWGGGFVALVFYTGLQTFNPRAFDNPTYTGSLRQADWIIALVKDAFNKAEALSDKLRHVAGNLNTLYGRINSLPREGGSVDDAHTIRILHISDIHNNPAAVDFVRELADRIKVNVVIDTGDLTDFGSPVETTLSQGMGLLHIPYVFVAGNHDSQATVNAVSSNPNAVVLRGIPVRVAGLTILGSPDPSSLRPGPGSVDTAIPALQAASVKLLAELQAAEQKQERVDIVCVHDPKQAAAVIGHAPLVLCGHEHRAYIEIKDATVICNAGTTGAAGARYFDKRQGVPLTAALLTFAKTPAPHLLHIDQVALDGSLGQYSITRRTFSSSMQPAPNPALPASR